MHVNIFKIFAVCVCIYICIINIHSTHSYIMQRKTCILDAINRYTALIVIKFCPTADSECTLYMNPENCF